MKTLIEQAILNSSRAASWAACLETTEFPFSCSMLAVPPYVQPLAKPLLAGDIHEEIRSFGSLAQAVADQGVPGVVAMRFNVFVETASRFMLDFYNSLADGTTVGDALNGARQRLSADPMRDTLPKRVPLEDWLVPVGYELEALRLFARRQGKPRLQFSAADIEDARHLDSSLPRRPDVGFFGRDETLLALDRAFDQHKVVLLHAFAGSGKTATAAEFARWYSQTGGIDGPVLFTSFEAHRTLGQTLEQLGRTFEKELTKAGIHWPTITDPAERRNIALHILRQFSVLWIWDNIEPVTGFPAGTSSVWDKVEQDELADFLRDASDAGTKFLLTSRRDERPWLGDLPARVALPPMPFRERFQLANALANKLRRSINEIEDWRPLLDFTQGNPLTITVLVGAALRSNLRTPSQIQTFVEMLRTGTANIHDEAEEGRSRSLAASLTYGLEHAFQPIQRKLLGLLALFQSVVNVNIFMHLGQGVKAIEEVKNSTEQEVRGIFETASQIGILEKASEFVYKVHPAVPWFFRQTFESHFKGRERECIESFCNVFMFVGAVLSQQYQEHVPGAAQALYREEANFLHAYELALQWKLWMPAAAVLHPIEDVYLLEGRMVEWKILVERLHGLWVKPGTADILPGAEEAWPYLAELLMRIAKAERRFEDAARYAVALVQHHREKADPYVSGQQPTSNGHEEIHNLAVMLDTLGSLKAEFGSSECLDHLQESLRLAQSINDDVQGAVPYSILDVAIAMSHLLGTSSARLSGLPAHWRGPCRKTGSFVEKRLRRLERHTRRAPKNCFPPGPSGGKKVPIAWATRPRLSLRLCLSCPNLPSRRGPKRVSTWARSSCAPIWRNSQCHFFEKGSNSLKR